VSYSLNQKNVQAEVVEEVARDLQLNQDVRPSRLGGLSGEIGARGGGIEEEDFLSGEASVARMAARVVSTSTEIYPPQRASYQEKTQPSRRFSRVVTGAILALALLGGAGAAIFPGQTPRGFSGVAAKIGEWFGTELDPVPRTREGEEDTTPFSPVFPVDPVQNQIRGERGESLENSIPSAQPESTEKEQLSSREEPSLERKTDSTPAISLSSWKDHPLRVESKMTVFDLVLKTYGTYNILAIDLIQESNPHLKSIEKIMVGEKLWLPPLTQETLVREQPDGKYQLILASFRNKRDAEKFAQRVRSQGYVVTVIPRKVVENLVVQRVVIQELKDLDEVEKAWGLVNINNAFWENLRQ
jgi:hypothetical protein